MKWALPVRWPTASCSSTKAALPTTHPPMSFSTTRPTTASAPSSVAWPKGAWSKVVCPEDFHHQPLTGVTMKPNPLLLSLLATGLCGLPLAAQAQSAPDFEALRNQLKALRAQLHHINTPHPAPPGGIGLGLERAHRRRGTAEKRCRGAGRHPGQFPLARQRDLDPHLWPGRGQPGQGLQGHGARRCLLECDGAAAGRVPQWQDGADRTDFAPGPGNLDTDL